MKRSKKTVSHLSPGGTKTDLLVTLNLEGGRKLHVTGRNVISLFEREKSEFGADKVIWGCQHIIMKVGHAAVKTAYSVRKSRFTDGELIHSFISSMS